MSRAQLEKELMMAQGNFSETVCVLKKAVAFPDILEGVILKTITGLKKVNKILEEYKASKLSHVTTPVAQENF